MGWSSETEAERGWGWSSETGREGGRERVGVDQRNGGRERVARVLGVGCPMGWPAWPPHFYVWVFFWVICVNLLNVIEYIEY